MQSYSLAVDPTLTEADLPALGARLQLPPGWRYRVRQLSGSGLCRSTGKPGLSRMSWRTPISGWSRRRRRATSRADDPHEQAPDLVPLESMPRAPWTAPEPRWSWPGSCRSLVPPRPLNHPSPAMRDQPARDADRQWGADPETGEPGTHRWCARHAVGAGGGAAARHPRADRPPRYSTAVS